MNNQPQNSLNITPRIKLSGNYIVLITFIFLVVFIPAGIYLIKGQTKSQRLLKNESTLLKDSGIIADNTFKDCRNLGFLHLPVYDDSVLAYIGCNSIVYIVDKNKNSIVDKLSFRDDFKTCEDNYKKIFDYETKFYKKYNQPFVHVDPCNISSIDKKDTILSVGIADGTVIFNLDNKEKKKIKYGMYPKLAFDDNMLWIGSTNGAYGLIRYNLKTNTIDDFTEDIKLKEKKEYKGKSYFYVKTILVTPNSTYVVRTDDRIFGKGEVAKFDKKTQTWEIYDSSFNAQLLGYSQNNVYGIDKDANIFKIMDSQSSQWMNVNAMKLNIGTALARRNQVFDPIFYLSGGNNIGVIANGELFICTPEGNILKEKDFYYEYEDKSEHFVPEAVSNKTVWLYNINSLEKTFKLEWKIIKDL